MFWFFWPRACGILALRPGIEPAPPALEGEVLITGPPGKSQWWMVLDYVTAVYVQLKEDNTVYLFVLLSMDIWIVSSFSSLASIEQETFFHVSSGKITWSCIAQGLNILKFTKCNQMSSSQWFHQLIPPSPHSKKRVRAQLLQSSPKPPYWQRQLRRRPAFVSSRQSFLLRMLLFIQ